MFHFSFNRFNTNHNVVSIFYVFSEIKLSLSSKIGQTLKKKTNTKNSENNSFENRKNSDISTSR